MCLVNVQWMLGGFTKEIDFDFNLFGMDWQCRFNGLGLNAHCIFNGSWLCVQFVSKRCSMAIDLISNCFSIGVIRNGMI